MRIEDHYGAPAYCALCDHPCSVGPLCNACMADDDDDDDDEGPPDDSWIQSSLERAAGPPRIKTDYYDGGKLKHQKERGSA